MVAGWRKPGRGLGRPGQLSNRNPALGLPAFSFQTSLVHLPSIALDAMKDWDRLGLIAPCPDHYSSLQGARTGHLRLLGPVPFLPPLSPQSDLILLLSPLAAILVCPPTSLHSLWVPGTLQSGPAPPFWPVLSIQAHTCSRGPARPHCLPFPRSASLSPFSS